MNDDLIVMWKDERGVFSQDAPGKRVASTLSATALKRLAEKHRVFVLELDADGGIAVTEIKKSA
jgi:hypothetical protein